MNQKSAAAQGESRFRIARPSLIVRERPVRGRTTGKEFFSERNARVSGKPLNPAELKRSRDDDVFPDRMVSRVTYQHARKIRLRAEGAQRNAGIESVVDAAMRIDRIVTAVLNECHREHPDPLRLRV